MKHKINLVCTCDSKYLPLLEAFLRSLKQNGGVDVHVYIRLIDVFCGVPWLSDVLKRDYEIWYTYPNLNTTRNKLINEGMVLHDFVAEKNIHNKNKTYKGARWLYSDMMAYCANIKFNSINRLLTDGVENIFYFDVDTIVRKDLSDLVLTLQKHDMLVKRTPSNPDKPFSEPYTHLYHTGIIGVSNTARSRQFFTTLEKRVNDSDFYNWDTDQIEFAELIENKRFNINHHDITDNFKDEYYNDSSSVWCGAAAGKVSNDKYITEMNKYVISQQS